MGVKITIFCNQGPKLWERIHLLQLLTLNEYAAHYAAARHYLGLVNVTTLISTLYLWLTRSRRSTSSCSSAFEVANRMMSSTWQRLVSIRPPIC